MRKFLVFLAIPAALAIAGCQGAQEPGTQNPVPMESGNKTASGMLLVDRGFHVDSPELDAKGCPPDATVQGQQVVMKDAAGQTVGVADLGPSEKVHASDPPQLDPVNPDYGYPILCGYRFEISNLPPADFYTLTAGGGMEVTVTAAELDGEIKLMAR